MIAIFTETKHSKDILIFLLHNFSQWNVSIDKSSKRYLEQRLILSLAHMSGSTARRQLTRPTAELYFLSALPADEWIQLKLPTQSAMLCVASLVEKSKHGVH